jgi:hypothetical protein
MVGTGRPGFPTPGNVTAATKRVVVIKSESCHKSLTPAKYGKPLAAAK